VPGGKKSGAGAGRNRQFVRGEDLTKWTEGSLEAQLDLVERTLEAAVKGPVELLATRADGALFRTPDGALHEAAFTAAPGQLEGVEIHPSTIPVHEAATLPRLVADELRDLTAAMLRGEAVERARVRAVAELLVADEQYTLGAVLQRADEACAQTGDTHWFTLYEANQEKIRTTMWGQIRELEARVPKTAYARLPRTRLPEFEPELRESMGLLGGVLTEVVDGISPLVFDRDDEFLGAIRDSLIAEAQTLHGLLAKAGQLIRAEDLERAAVAHDRWCGRARTMEVVSAYLKGRANKGAEEAK
jgi:hypothetical protein